MTTPAPWAGLTPRRWQAEALPVALASIRARQRGVVSAVMGSGKSRLQAEVAASGRGRVLVTVPTVALVEQMAATMSERCPGEVGCYYTHAKDADKRITICCLPSVPTLLTDTAWPGPPALWICDEAHRSECATLLAAHATMAPGAAIAFTATPFRAADTEELSLWQREIYVYSVGDALRDGVVVPFRPVPWSGADGADVTEAAIAMVREVKATGPGLVNAASIADAEACAAAFNAAGIRAAAVHSRSRDTAQSIAALKAGDLDCIVHVNMLSEGVDLPWLRWLCMRRPTQSRVRFCQEVGRVLRSWPGKTEALLLDPLDLLGAFSLSYEAILAGMGGQDGAAPFERELTAATRDDAPADTGLLDIQARRLAAWRRYLRSLYIAALAAGLVECRAAGSGWRRNAPSEKQVGAVRYALAGLARDTRVPTAHRRLLAEIGDHAGDMRRGDVSDLLSVGFALRDTRRNGRDAWALLCAAHTGGDE